MKLRELIEIYNFRNYREELKRESNKYDTVVIRIYLNMDLSEHDYVEFGVNDFSEEEYKRDLYERFINKEILDTEVQSMHFDYDLNTFCVHLKKR